MATFDSESYVETLVTSVSDVVQAVGRESAGHRFYALAILDLEVPRFALNSEEAFESRERSFSSARFDPAEFRWARLDLPHKLPCAAGKTQRRRALIEGARRLTKELPKRIASTKDFIVFVFDPKDGLALVKKTVPKKLFQQLFPEHDPLYAERQRLESLPPPERAEALMNAFSSPGGIGWEEATTRLSRMGAEAVPSLVSALGKREKERWQIARALGRIGPTRAAPAIPALRRYADDESTGGNWCAMVLGFLGDGAFLVDRAKEGSQVAIGGICSTLRSFADEAQRSSGERIPLAYDLLESLLDANDANQRRVIENDLTPGRSYRHELHPLDVDRALKALTSRHAVLRWHAASVLGNVKLRKKQQALPIVNGLIPLIKDRSKLVRRLAMLSLEDHRRHLDPVHWRALADRVDETDPVARSVAEKARQHLTGK